MTTDLPRAGGTVPRRVDAIVWFTDRCVKRAAGRWPGNLSDPMAREWRAELAALRVDRTTSRVGRAWRAIRFATSLATSPPVEPSGGAPSGWRERTSGLGGAAAAAAGFIGVALLAVAFPAVANPVFGNMDQYFSSAMVSIIVAVMLTVAAAAMGWIGTRVARGRGATGSPLLASLYAAVPIGAALAVIFGAQADQISPNWRSLAAMAAVWLAGIAATSTIAARVRSAGHRGAAWVSGVIGAAITCDLACIAASASLASRLKLGLGNALAWLPMSFLPEGSVRFGHSYGSDLISFGNESISGSDLYASTLVLDTVATVAGPLLLCSAFVIARAIRLAAPMTASLAAAPVRAPKPLPRSARAVALTRQVALLGIVVGVAAWTYQSVHSLDAPQPLQYQLLEFTYDPWLRFGAIALVSVALGLLVAGRAASGVVATAAFLVLFGTDCIVTNSGWHHALIVVPIVLVSVATVAVGWWLAPRLTGADGSRRALVTIAVFGALALITSPDTGSSFGSGIAVTYVLDAILWCVAITAALASRPVPVSGRAATAYVVVPLIGLLAFVSGTAANALYYPRSTFFIQVPLAVVVLAAARFDGGRHPARSAVRWLLAGLSAAVISVPLSDMASDNGGLLNTVVAHLEYGSLAPLLHHASPVSGQFLLALAVGLLCGWWTVPPAMPVAADPDPVEPVPVTV